MSSSGTASELEKLSDSQRHELAQKLVDQQNAEQPLISEVAPIEVLLHEYANNRQFYNKVKWLKDQSDFVGIRRLKGDGNCFYRAFGFTYIHTLLTMNDRPLHHFTTQHLGSTLELLKQAGFEEDVVKDFYDPFQELMAMMHSTDPATPQLDEKKLLEVFNDPEKSNSIVVYLRLLTSAFLKLNSNDYTPFLASATGEEDPPTMEDFCNKEVEAFGRDADHLQITALSSALKVSLDVVYLSRSHAPPESDSITEEADAGAKMSDNKDVSPEGDPNACDVVRFDIDQGQMFGLGPLLYRPGHFDLLVAREEPESPDINI